MNKRGNPMKIIYTFIAFALLASCSGDNTSDEAPEILQNSFTSKPTDQQVIAFLKKEGRYAIELTNDAGKYSTYELRKRWQKGFAFKANANIENNPDAVLQVGGFVRFEVNGNNYDFASVQPITTEIFGLEPPKEAVLVNIINNNMQKFYPNYRNIVYQQPVIKLPKNLQDRNTVWYSELSFRIDFNMDFYVKSGGSKIDKVHCVKGVRFYRNTVVAPFDSLLQEKKTCKTLESKRYSYEEFDKIPSIQPLKTGT